MSLPVDVKSVDVLVAVREGMILFAEDSKSALGSMESEIRRCLDWLAHDQRMFWQNEVKRRKEKLAEAKAELHRKQLSQMFGAQGHDSQQRDQIREATARLEQAEDKVEAVHRWVPLVERAVMEYNGQARPFADMMEFEAERAVELLDRMILAIEEYTAITAPSTERPMPAVSTATATATNPQSPVATPAANPLIPIEAPSTIPEAVEPREET